MEKAFKCSRCRETKPASDFPKDSSRKSGVHGYCSECNNIRSREWYAENADKKKPRTSDDIRRYNLNRALKDRGITPDQYFQLLVQQNGVCAICEQEPRGRSSVRFCIDHDHVTGKVRGLLCGFCNSAVGLFEDDSQRLRRAADYIEEGRR